MSYLSIILFVNDFLFSDSINLKNQLQRCHYENPNCVAQHYAQKDIKYR